MTEDKTSKTEQKETRNEDDSSKVKRVFVNPLIIEEYTGTGKKTHTYFKEWCDLYLHVSDYEFLRTYKVLKTDEWGALQDILDEQREEQNLEPDGENDEEKEKGRNRREFRHLAKRARENFDGLSEKEQSEFRWAHRREVRPYEERRELRLVCWAEIKRRASIKTFLVAKKGEADNKKIESAIEADPDEIESDQSFDRIYLYIREYKNDLAGLLMLQDYELRKYDEHDPDEDYLLAEMYVKEGTLAELENEVRQRGGNVPLEVMVQAHLFEKNMISYVRELRPDTHYIPYIPTERDSPPCSIILDSITVGEKPEPKWADNSLELENDLYDEAQEEVPDPESQFRERILGAVSDLSNAFGHIKVAIWILTIILLISLFV